MDEELEELLEEDMDDKFADEGRRVVLCLLVAFVLDATSALEGGTLADAEGELLVLLLVAVGVGVDEDLDEDLDNST